MSSNRTTDAPPDQLGPYHIEKQIGVGGMGAVFRARDERLMRSVALKRIRRSLHGTSARRRLAREAQVIAQMSHPNIVQVYDFLTHEGCDWIVMELVDGLTLGQILQRGRPEVEEVIGYSHGIAKGLAAAHARGIVHRDLKTENVMITSEGSVKILDFGLATVPLLGTVPQNVLPIQGTPRAMAPEQAMGNPTDHRSDLFSFGVLLYECLSGESPFAARADDACQTLLKVCSYCPPPVNDIRPAVPQELARLVECLLEKDPAARPESAEDVLIALQRLRNAAPSRTRVLFVDDEPDHELLIRQWYQRRFGKDRFELLFAGEGFEALEMLRNDPKIHLVFTDLRMPGMDGMQLLGEISKLERSCISVVVSAFGDITNIRSAMNFGAFDFVTKPFDFEDLELTLEKAAGQVATLRESIRLRAENQFLDERNKAFRLAFSRYLLGDPNFGRVFEPLVDQVQMSGERHLTLLSLEIEGFSSLPGRLPAAWLFSLADGFWGEVIALVQLYRGEILAFSAGRLSIGFGFVFMQETDNERAQQCARELRHLIEGLSVSVQDKGGSPLAAKCVVDVGGVVIDGESGNLSGELPDRAGRFLANCSTDQILVLNTIHGTELTEQSLD